jgi:multidrug efflux pump subunit AcrA (membrane-fusion protein)
LSRDEFFSRTLDVILRGLSGVGVAVWNRTDDGPRTIAERLPLEAAQVNGRSLASTAVRTQRAGLVSFVLEAGQAGLLPPKSPATIDRRAANPTDFFLLVVPWMVDGEAAGVIEVFQNASGDDEVQTAQMKFLEAVGEVIGDYERAGRQPQVHDESQAAQLQAAQLQAALRANQFAAAVHESIELRPTAYSVANEGRLLLGCDRLSVLRMRGGRCQVLAVSGVDIVHRRARATRRLERLAAAVAAIGSPLWHPADDSTADYAEADVAPQIAQPLEAYLDDSHASSLAILPLKVPMQPNGEETSSRVVPHAVLVAESFYGKLDRAAPTWTPLCRHSALALRRAEEVDELPLAHLLRHMRWLFRRPMRSVAVLLAISAVVAALVLIPGELRISAHGELQPRNVREVFAQADGLVSDLHVEHGQVVAENDLLAQLRRPQLDLEFKQVLGDLQTAHARLDAIEAERSQAPRETDQQRHDYSQLLAQAEDLRATISGLESQHAVLLLKQKELDIRSPMRGQVLTWNVRPLLEARPVRRGQSLLTIGEIDGPWQLELHVRDRDIAHVLEAQKAGEKALSVEYMLGTQAGVKLHGTIRSVAQRVEASESEGPSVDVVVDVDRADIAQPVPGATVTAQIDCGREPIGYVWLHELIDSARSWLFL